MAARLTRHSGVVFIALACALPLPQAVTAQQSIHVWKVGSPHRGDTPPATVPESLSTEVAERGYRLVVQSFPPSRFAATFRDAAARGEAPDVIAFDNLGIMNGITTPLGTFEGLAEEPAFRGRFTEVTDAFDSVLGPARGWTYLFTSSPNHNAARRLALRGPACGNNSSPRQLHPKLSELVSKAAVAYLGADVATLLALSDPERIPPGTSHHEPVTSGEIRVCGSWGTDRLQFVSVSAAYEGKSTLGHRTLLLVFRNSSGAFQLLTAARDPVSNGRFLQALASAPVFLAIDESSGERAIPARLLSPNPGEYPSPARGQRFGTFSWQSSPSDDVVAEVVEFAYKDDARLFFRARPGRATRHQVSAGELWTTGGEWTWRIWSIARSGEVAFSDVRMFTH